MSPEEELDIVIKKIYTNESQIKVLDNAITSLSNDVDHIRKQQHFLLDDYHRLKLESLSTEKEVYDYILNSDITSGYISNNIDKYLPNGCSFRGIVISTNQREISLNLDLEPSKNEEKIEKILSNIQDANLSQEFSSHLISCKSNGKYMSLRTVRNNESYRLIYVNNLNAYYLMHNGKIVQMCTTVKLILTALNEHLDIINNNKLPTCTSYFL